jgi:hypothetical protein
MDGRQRRDSAFMAALQFLLIHLIDEDASLEALIWVLLPCLRKESLESFCDHRVRRPHSLHVYLHVLTTVGRGGLMYNIEG